MYQHFNTRRKLAQRIVTYILMVCAVLVGVAGTTAWILGYRLNLDQEQEQAVERITLLQFGSFPTNANIFVNDEELNFNTPGRYDGIRAGENVLKYQLEGYHNWQITANLKPAEVRWVNYARMVPNKIDSTEAVQVAGFDQALAAPNGSYILLHETAASSTFKILDISDPNNVRATTIELPASTLTPPIKDVKIIEWDSSSNYVLLSQDGNIIRLDRRDTTKSDNLTKLFGIEIGDPHFLNGNNNIVFGLTDTNLRRFDIGAKTASSPLVQNVISYEAYGDGKLSYVGESNGQQSVGVYYKDKDYLIEIFDDTKGAHASFTHYYREDHFLYTHDGVLTVAKNPFSADHKDKTNVEMPLDAEYLFHNGGGRFVIAGRGNEVLAYDLETQTQYNYDLESFKKKPFWLDDYHLGYIHNGELKMIEFSGDNRESLVSATEFGVFSSNNEHLFTFQTGVGGTFLIDSSMLAKPQAN